MWKSSPVLVLSLCLLSLPAFANHAAKGNRKPASVSATQTVQFASPSLTASLQGEQKLPGAKHGVTNQASRGDSKVGPFRVKAAGGDTPRSFAENAYFE